MVRLSRRGRRQEGGGLGESIALSAGVAKAKGDLVVNAPPYLQIEPDDVVSVVKALEAGADCVATWRHSRIDPWLNQLQSKLFNAVLRVVMNTPFHDLNSGTRGFRRQVGTKAAVAALFGRRYLKSKRAATSNWANRHLNEAQLLYAANDAWAALRVYEALGRPTPSE